MIELIPLEQLKKKERFTSSSTGREMSDGVVSWVRLLPPLLQHVSVESVFHVTAAATPTTIVSESLFDDRSAGRRTVHFFQQSKIGGVLMFQDFILSSDMLSPHFWQLIVACHCCKRFPTTRQQQFVVVLFYRSKTSTHCTFGWPLWPKRFVEDNLPLIWWRQ